MLKDLNQPLMIAIWIVSPANSLGFSTPTTVQRFLPFTSRSYYIIFFSSFGVGVRVVGVYLRELWVLGVRVEVGR